MVPGEYTAEHAAGPRHLLEPEVMGPPIVWLASAEAAGVTDERIVAIEFEEWLTNRSANKSKAGA
jgi:gluconate 5-dehydrogenase